MRRTLRRGALRVAIAHASGVERTEGCLYASVTEPQGLNSALRSCCAGGLTSRARVLVRLLVSSSCNDASRVPQRSIFVQTLLLTPESPETNAALRAPVLVRVLVPFSREDASRVLQRSLPRRTPRAPGGGFGRQPPRGIQT